MIKTSLNSLNGYTQFRTSNIFLIETSVPSVPHMYANCNTFLQTSHSYFTS